MVSNLESQASSSKLGISLPTPKKNESDFKQVKKELSLHSDGEEDDDEPRRKVKGPKIKEAESIKFLDLLSGPKYRPWKQKFYKKVASALGCLKEIFMWIRKAEFAESLQDLDEPGYDPFETLSAKVASGLSEIMHGEFVRIMQHREEEAAKERQDVEW